MKRILLTIFLLFTASLCGARVLEDGSIINTIIISTGNPTKVCDASPTRDYFICVKELSRYSVKIATYPLTNENDGIALNVYEEKENVSSSAWWAIIDVNGTNTTDNPMRVPVTYKEHSQ